MLDVNYLITLGAVQKNVRKGEIIFMEGSKCQYYHQLISGSVKYVNTNNEGKEYLQMLVQPGECFGEMGLIDGGCFAATAIAEETSVVLKMCASTFHNLLVKKPDLQIELSKLLVQRLRSKFFILKELLTNAPEERICALIDHLRSTNRNYCPICGQLKLTRQQIANMTCLRVETVIRSMRAMNESGKIEIRRGKVYIKNHSSVFVQHCAN